MRDITKAFKRNISDDFQCGLASDIIKKYDLEEARVHLDDIAPFIDSETSRIYRNRTLFIGGK